MVCVVCGATSIIILFEVCSFFFRLRDSFSGLRSFEAVWILWMIFYLHLNFCTITTLLMFIQLWLGEHWQWNYLQLKSCWFLPLETVTLTIQSNKIKLWFQFIESNALISFAYCKITSDLFVSHALTSFHVHTIRNEIYLLLNKWLYSENENFKSCSAGNGDST